MSEEYKKAYDAVTFEVRGIIYISSNVEGAIVKRHPERMKPFFLQLDDKVKADIWAQYPIAINYNLVKLVKERIANELDCEERHVNLVNMQLWGKKNGNEFSLDYPLRPDVCTAIISKCNI